MTHSVKWDVKPYHIIPYHTIPNQTTRYQTTPYHTIPHHTKTKPNHMIPYHTTPYQTKPHHTTPHHTKPYLSSCFSLLSSLCVLYRNWAVSVTFRLIPDLAFCKPICLLYIKADQVVSAIQPVFGEQFCLYDSVRRSIACTCRYRYSR